MISLHTNQIIPMKDLLDRGMILTPIAGTSDLVSVEIPARGGVGPIHGTWRLQPGEKLEVTSERS